jgi:diphthamide biosynthesis protein 2
MAQGTTDRKDDADASDEDADRPMFSLVTGTYRQAKRYGSSADASPAAVVTADSENPSAVVLRNQDNALSVLSNSAAGEYSARGVRANGRIDDDV